MGPKNENRPCGLYETMLRRVCPYTLRGFLFYQGESDDHRPETYETLLTALIGCWRRDWDDSTLAFLNVQLPMYRAAYDPDYKHWCRIREAQANVYRKLRGTGLAVLADCGEFDNIHPKEKATAGHRLALQALCEVYHKMPRAKASAPMFVSGYPAGSSFVIRTENAADGFRLTGDAAGFELAGADGIFYPADAAFAPDCITLTAKQVAAPRYARYAWTNYTEVSVYGMNRLPLMPFRTDHIPLSEEKCAYSCT
jgi:sialate O-acetylesterase